MHVKNVESVFHTCMVTHSGPSFSQLYFMRALWLLLFVDPFRLLHIEDTLDKYIVFQAVKSALECNPLIAHVILDMTEVYRKAAALGELAIPNDRRGLQKRELKIGEHTVILWFGMSVSLMVQEDVFIKATGLSAVGV